jgi:hypothetical protein
MITYKNRYGDVYTFSKTEDGDILFQGEFKWMRCGWPNDYTEAYDKYCSDVDLDERMTLGEFKNQVHHYDADTFEAGKITKAYAKYVKSNQSVINMIDPSGGPYLHSEHDMGTFDPSFKGMIIQEFKSVSEGYLIVIEK